jgi:hypothetical protein
MQFLTPAVGHHDDIIVFTDTDSDEDEDKIKATIKDDADAHATSAVNRDQLQRTSKRTRSAAETDTDSTASGRSRKASRSVPGQSPLVERPTGVASQQAAIEGHLTLLALLKEERDKNVQLEKDKTTLQAQALDHAQQLAAMRGERDKAQQELAALRTSVANFGARFGGS